MADTRKNYKWTGINAHGKRAVGTILSNNTKEAQMELKKMGVEVINLIQQSEQKSKSIFQFSKKIKTKDILLFTRYLSSMLSAGLSIMQALDIMSKDKENAATQHMILTLRSNISSGKTLSESFNLYPKIFSEFYRNLIRVGEKSGTLDKILKRLADYLEKTDILRKKIKKALVYPSAIITIAMLVSAVLLIFVVPQFEKMFTSLGSQLPFFTRMVVSFSYFLQKYWWLIIIFCVLGITFFKRKLDSSEQFRESWDNFLLRLPIMGSILRKGMIARYTRTLGTMLDAGMPIVEAMKTVAPLMENITYKKAVFKLADEIKSGKMLSSSMENTQLFPNMAIQMIAVGEASGSLSEMLNKVAEYYEDEVNNMVDNLSSLLEPLIMLILGVIVGTFVVAMYLPIFKMGSLF